MTSDAKKLFGNHALKLAQQVSVVRRTRDGVQIGEDLRRTMPKISKKDRLPAKLVKRLAGG